LKIVLNALPPIGKQLKGGLFPDCRQTDLNLQKLDLRLDERIGLFSTAT
jgi:hypothetical protein